MEQAAAIPAEDLSVYQADRGLGEDFSDLRDMPFFEGVGFRREEDEVAALDRQ